VNATDLTLDRMWNAYPAGSRPTLSPEDPIQDAMNRA